MRRSGSQGGISMAAAARLFQPRSTVINLKPSNSARFRSAMARTDRNAVVVCTGPSTTAGQSTGAGTAQAVIAWPMRTAALLQAQGIPAGAGNFFGDKGRWGGGGTITGLLAGDGRLAVTGATDRGGADSAGGNPVAFTAAGTLTFTPQQSVTKFDVWTRDTAAAGTISASVDGGATTAITSAVAGAGIKKTTIAAGAVGTHTLKLDWVSGTLFVVGASGYDDTGGRREVSFYNFGISGATSSRFLLNSSPGIGTTTFTTFVAPDLIVLDDLAINDWRQGVPLATSRANILMLVQHAKSTGATVVLTTPLWDANAGGASPQQDAYAAMIAEVAMAEDVILLDVRAAWVSYVVANGLGWYSDSVHPAALGYNVKAIAFTELVRRMRAI